MKRTNYFLALILSSATITSAHANIEGQENPGHTSLTNPSSTPEQFTQNESVPTAEFVIMGSDFSLKPEKGDTQRIQVKSTSIVYKPQQGSEEKSFDNKEFSKLWSSSSQFGQSNPSATLVWHKGQDQYEMTVTITNATAAKNKSLTLTAVSTNPESSFQRNGQTISQEEFLKAAAENGKQDVAVWVNEYTHEAETPTGAGSEVGTATETGH